MVPSRSCSCVSLSFSTVSWNSSCYRSQNVCVLEGGTFPHSIKPRLLSSLPKTSLRLLFSLIPCRHRKDQRSTDTSWCSLHASQMLLKWGQGTCTVTCITVLHCTRLIGMHRFQGVNILCWFVLWLLFVLPIGAADHTWNQFLFSAFPLVFA